MAPVAARIGDLNFPWGPGPVFSWVGFQGRGSAKGGLPGLPPGRMARGKKGFGNPLGRGPKKGGSPVERGRPEEKAPIGDAARLEEVEKEKPK